MKRESMEISLKRVPKLTVILGLIFGLIGGIIFDPIRGMLIFLGALFSVLGFITLISFVDRYLGKQKNILLRRALLAYFLRLLLICLVFLIIIFFFKSKIVAFVAGFSLIVISILIEAVRSIGYMRQWKA